MASSVEEQAEPPRKKVRKGTRSCWECKRRKIRCSFAAPADVICLGCKGRGTPCVSQEFPYVPALACSKSGVEDRLGRVEVLVEQLVERLVQDKDVDDASHVLRQAPGSPRPSPGVTRGGATSPDGQRISTRPGTDPEPDTHPAAAGIRHGGLARTLRAAWPSPRELDLILSQPVGTSGFLLRKAGCTEPRWDSASARETLQLPPPGSHPVLVATKLLILCIHLQGVPISSVQRLERLGVSCCDIMSRAADAVQLVTGSDELANSIEGVECLVMLSTYLENAGNIGRAWVVARQAMAVALVMGLHRGSGRGGGIMKTLDLGTKTRINPEQLWFRLVQIDRYLSMMLGLPHSWIDDDFATPKALASCALEERMRRIHCSAAGRILQRNNAEADLAQTREIDQLLQGAASSVPPEWWLPPELDAPLQSSSSSGGDHPQDMGLDNTARLMDQFVHYHLLLRLHLPYLLRSPADGNTSHHMSYLHSKITAVHVSRELLSRFVSFRKADPTGTYCTHAVNFLAFTAASALCLAHIEAWRQRQIQAQVVTTTTTTTTPTTIPTTTTTTTTTTPLVAMTTTTHPMTFLAHPRPSDRALIERALACIQSTRRSPPAPAPAPDRPDPTAAQMATILRHLLLIEADAARGGAYRHRTTPVPGPGPGPGSGPGPGPVAGGSSTSRSSRDGGGNSSSRSPSSLTSASATAVSPGSGLGPEAAAAGVKRGGGGGGDGEAGELDALEDGGEAEEAETETEEARAASIDVGRVSDGGRALRICIPHFGVIEIERADSVGARGERGGGLIGRQGEGGAEGVGEGVGPGAGAGLEQQEADWWALQGVDMAFESLIREIAEPEAALMQTGAEEQWAGWLGQQAL